MTVEEQTSDVPTCLPVGGLSRRPGPVKRTGLAKPPTVTPPSSQDELVSIRNMAARLRAVYPSVDAVTVETTVKTAYDSFRQARVRAYVPILVERRSRRVLRAACRTAPGQAVDRRAAPETAAPETRRAHPGPEKG